MKTSSVRYLRGDTYSCFLISYSIFQGAQGLSRSRDCYCYYAKAVCFLLLHFTTRATNLCSSNSKVKANLVSLLLLLPFQLAIKVFAIGFCFSDKYQCESP